MTHWPRIARLALLAVVVVAGCAREAPPPASVPPPPADAVPWPPMTFGAAAQARPPGDWLEERIVGVAASPERFVAVSVASAVGRERSDAWSSIDGIAWARASTPEVFEGLYLVDVAAGPGGFVALGGTIGDPFLGVESRPVLFRSDDGDRWQRLPDIAGMPRGFATGIAGGPLGYVATGFRDPEQGPIQLVSADGLAWRLVVGDEAGAARDGIGDPSAVDGGWRAVGSGLSVLRSADGISWSADAVEDGSTDAIVVTSVDAGPHGLVATGQAGASCASVVLNSCASMPVLWASADGAAWVRVPSDPSIASGPIVADPVRGFISLRLEAMASPDGWTWTSLGPMGDGQTEFLDGVVRGDILVAVGARYDAAGAARGVFAIGAPDGESPD